MGDIHIAHWQKYAAHCTLVIDATSDIHIVRAQRGPISRIVQAAHSAYSTGYSITCVRFINIQQATSHRVLGNLDEFERYDIKPYSQYSHHMNTCTEATL